jgi:hypothetical protein
MDFWINNSIALMSAFIALCAFILTILNSRQTIKHNKISVRPVLTTRQHHYPSNKEGTVAFELINAGLGAAIIKNFTLIYNDTTVSNNSAEQYTNFMKNLCKEFSDVLYGMYVPGGVMQVSEHCVLLSFKYNCQTQDVSFIEKINLVVEYQSMYRDQTFTYDSREDRLYHK